MDNLIPITNNKQGDRIVSAKNLYNFLEVGSDFNHWCKRMFEYGFEQDKDFTPFLTESIGGRPGTDYALTMDCAKEISMLQRTDRGKQARQYFIEKEKEALSFRPVLTRRQMAEAVIEAENRIDRLEIEGHQKDTQLQLQAPMIEIWKKAMNNEGLLLMSQVAKIICKKLGRNKLYTRLRAAGVIFKKGTEPYQVYIEKGYFVIKEKFIQTGTGERLVMTTYVTQSGLLWLNDNFGDQAPVRKQIQMVM